MKTIKKPVSQETQAESMKIAKATQKPGQTKEQTKLIAQGIEKGIALYKKQQKERSRQADKAKKKTQKEKLRQSEPSTTADEVIITEKSTGKDNTMLPWMLLLVSWIGFFTYVTTI